MAEIRLTAAQQAVVDHRGGALLVSAAAGSGKTKVLVDRLLAQVCDDMHEVNLDDFLIITYTKAAAAELRAKIAKELAKRLAAEPDNVHLQRQSTRIYLTQISTVHAFCASILREYAHVLDIPADFRVGEEQETSALRQSIFDDLLEELYTTLDAHPDRRALIDQLGYGRDDARLYGLVMDVYDAVRCRVSPEGWIARCKAAYVFSDGQRAEETLWGAYLIEELRQALDAAERNLDEALRLMRDDDVLLAVHAPLVEENLRAVRALAACKTWDEFYENQITGFGTLKPIRKPLDAARKETTKELRASALAGIRAAQKAFYAPSERVMRDLENSAPAIRGLLELVELFDTRFSEEKRRGRLFDFSDLEHQSLRLLWQRNSNLPSAAAREIAARYREIMVDEYQDSNAVQERIFEAVSKDGKNRFMVGDVKQSIYRFRLADPSIFLEKYRTYQTQPDSTDTDSGRKIILSENFRSRPEILSAVNDVFSLVMHRQAAELDYTQDEALKNGNQSFLPTPQPKIELHCIQVETGGEKKATKADTEAEFVAARIERMLHDGTQVMDGQTLRPVRAGDIVILMRSPSSAAESYAAALARHQIGCVSDRGGSLLATTECEVFAAILQIVDNPHRDIPLVTAMASQVFGFSPEELAAARAGSTAGDLYDSLCEKQGENAHLAQFLSWLSHARRRARELPLCELMDELLLTTGLDSVFLAMPNGETRAANLLALRQLAEDNAAAYGGSLSGFCAFLDRLAESGGAAAGSQPDAAVDAVRLMSIHKSKGLEYPVVFLAGLSSKFNQEDMRSAAILDDELLIGTNIVDAEAKAYYSGIARMALSRKRKLQLLAEEMRVLYVAMTRAKEMLIMSYCEAKLDKTLEKWNRSISRPLRPEVSMAALSCGDWVLMQALCRTEAGELFAVCGDNPYSQVSDVPWKICYHTGGERAHAGTDAVQKQESAAQPVREVDEELLDFVYPHMAATRTASKLTATQLKGRELDLEAAQEAQPLRAEKPEAFRRPDFTPRTQLSGREKGSATHLFMQYVRYAACATREGLEGELARLTAEHFLTQQQAQSVNLSQILTLFTGAFGQRILAAHEPVREFKFSILTDAGAYLADAAGEQVMLQGVVDCFWQEDGGLVIVDFKTDRTAGRLEEKTADYAPQLSAYALALSRIYGQPVKAKYLYFFDAGQAVELP